MTTDEIPVKENDDISIEIDDVQDKVWTWRRKTYAGLALALLIICIIFLVVYVYAYYKIRETMLAPAASPIYMLSNFQNNSFTVRCLRNSTFNAPAPFTILASRLYYGTEDENFGYFTFPAFDVVPGVPSVLEFTDNFVITDTQLLESVGHSILEAFANQDSKSFKIVTRGTIGVKILAFIRWNIDYLSEFQFQVGPIHVNTSAPNTIPFELLSWQLKPFGFRLIARYDNPLPLSIEFGDISANIRFDNEPLSEATVQDHRLHLNNNIAVVDFTSIRFWKMVGFFIGFQPSSLSTLSLQNLTISRNGSEVEWLNGWFENVVFRFPKSP